MKPLHFIILSFMLSSVVGCYKNSEQDHTVIIKEIPDVIIDHNLIGQIYDQQSQMVTQAEIVYNGEIITLNDQSFFYIETQKVNQFYEKLNIKVGNHTIPYFVPMVENQTNYARYILPELQDHITINTGQNEELLIDNHSIVFEKNQFKFNGEQVNGNLSYQTTQLQVRGKGHHPGSRIAMNNKGQLNLLKAGNIFSLHSSYFDEFSATLSLTNEEIYALDEEEGVWRPIDSDGTDFHLNKNGWYAIGQTSPLSVVRGQLVNESSVINGETILTSNNGLDYFIQTTDEGYFITYGELNTDFNIKVKQDCEGNTYRSVLSENEQDLGKQVVEFNDVRSYIIKGTIKDCGNNSIEESILKITLSDGEEIFKSINQFDFETAVLSCQSIEHIELESHLTSGSSTSQRLAYETSDTIDVFQIHVCDDLKDEYLSLSINNEVDKFLLGGEAVMQNGRVYLNFFDENDPDLKITFITNSERQNKYSDEDLNIILEAESLGNSGYELQCGDSNLGCGFDRFVITEYGTQEGDYIRGYYKGRFWTKTFKPIPKAGYKTIEGVFHVKRSF